MGIKIRCSTLFDITKTNITNRRPSGLDDPMEWQNKRNTQVNFDTIIQVISLRAQPEDITDPKVKEVDLSDTGDKFGFMINSDNPIKVWSFTFYVNYGQVFRDEEGEYGALYSDCESVPMINIGSHLPAFLDISPELRNIHFETYEDE